MFSTGTRKHILDFNDLREKELLDYLEKLGFNKEIKTATSFNAFSNRTTLSSQESMDLVSVVIEGNGYSIDELRSFHDNVDYYVEYYSMYEDEKFRIGNFEYNPQ